MANDKKRTPQYRVKSDDLPDWAAMSSEERIDPANWQYAPGYENVAGGVYYNPSGGLWSGEDTSYWQNKKDNLWYQGLSSGEVSQYGENPPWRQTQQVSYQPDNQYQAAQIDPAYSSLLSRLSLMPYDEDYVNLQTSQLRENLMNTAAASRSELANRLASAGVEGGQALDRLADVDRTAALGMSQGLRDIQLGAMEQGYEDRRAALAATLTKYGIDAETAAGMADIALRRELGLGELGLQESQQELERLLGLGDIVTDRQSLALQGELGRGELELGRGELDLARQLGLGELDLAQIDRLIEMDRLNQEFGLRTREDQVEFAMFLIQMAQYADIEESERLMDLAETVLGSAEGTDAMGEW